MEHRLKLQGPKRILVATDFSKNSRSATEYGISLFGHIETEYILFNNCGPDVESLNLLASINDLLEINARKLLDKELDYLKRNRYGKIQIRSLLASGLANEAILRAAVKEKVDLIVMGTNGATTLRSMLMGSTAAAVINRTRCPVLIVPRALQLQPPHSIVYAADLEDVSSYSILNPLLALAEEYDSKLMVLNVKRKAEVPEGEEVVEPKGLCEYFNSYMKHSFHPILSSEIGSGIEKFIGSYEPDMLAMVIRNGLPPHRSMTQEMISRTKIPLLVMPDVQRV